MSSFLLVAGLLVILAVVAAVLAVVFGAGAVGRAATSDMVLVPGMSSAVPENWFGSHDPEARLWRRLRDAVRGVQASDTEHLGAGGTAAPIEQQALRVEEQLVAVTRLPRQHRAAVLTQLEQEVATIERLCADHVGRQAGWAEPEVMAELDAMSERLDVIAQARLQSEQRADPGTG